MTDGTSVGRFNLIINFVDTHFKLPLIAEQIANFFFHILDRNLRINYVVQPSSRILISIIYLGDIRTVSYSLTQDSHIWVNDLEQLAF